MTSTYDICEYGAVADGKTVNTKAIQAAVDACVAAGGGRVEVPAGVFLSGAILLKSRVELHLCAGAVLRGVQEVAAYPAMRITTQGYDIHHRRSSLVTAIGEKDIAITGLGTLDGQGAAWWKANADKARTPLVQITGCERVLLRDFRAMNSPEWSLLMSLSRDITVDRVKVENPWNHYYNNDGINFYSCRDVRVTHCQVDTGDDGITLKTLPGFHFESPNGKVDYSLPCIPCENIVVANCIVRHAHGGVVFGSETVGGIRDVVISGCIFEGTRQGIFVKGSIWGGFVRNVRVSGVIMKRVENGIALAAHGGGEQVMPDSRIPSARIEDIHCSNISMSQCSRAVVVEGKPDAWIRNLSFRNLRADADSGVTLLRAENVVVDDVTVSCRGIALEAGEVNGLEVRKLIALNAVPELPVLQFEKVSDALVHGCKAPRGAVVFLGLVGRDGSPSRPESGRFGEAAPLGNGGNEGEIVLEDNRLSGATAQAPVTPLSSWNSCSHAFSGCRWIRDRGTRNAWLPVSEAVDRFVRSRWTREQVDGIWSVSRVEANSRDGAEVEPRMNANGREWGADFGEPRRIYIVQSRLVDERLVVFEDGELLRTIDDPNFHAHFEERRDDFELARIDREAKETGKA